MNRQHWKLSLLAALAVALFFGVGTFVKNAGGEQAAVAPDAAAAQNLARAATVNWHPYEQGMDLAEDEDKKIYLYFFSDNCPYCTVMDNKTFTDQQTVSFLNANFTSIRLDTKKNRLLTVKYNVPGVPVSVFLEEDGEMIGAKPGYLSPEEFMKVLEFVEAESYKEE